MHSFENCEKLSEGFCVCNLSIQLPFQRIKKVQRFKKLKRSQRKFLTWTKLYEVFNGIVIGACIKLKFCSMSFQNLLCALTADSFKERCKINFHDHEGSSGSCITLFYGFTFIIRFRFCIFHAAEITTMLSRRHVGQF